MQETREAAYADFKSGMSLAEISRKHDVKLDTVKKWKKRYWTNEGTERGTGGQGGGQKGGQGDKVGDRGTKPPKPTIKESAQTTTDNTFIDSYTENPNDRLTEKQRLFCQCYSRTFNATQSYLRAYGGTYNTAKANGYRLLTNADIISEVERLKEIKRLSIMATTDDLVELHMRIAFADMNDFVEVSNALIEVDGNPVNVTDPTTDKLKPLIRTIVNAKPSDVIDGQLVREISEGREGVKVKLADSNRSLAFLERWFEANPMDKHKKDYDNSILKLKQDELDLKRNGGGAVDYGKIAEATRERATMFVEDPIERNIEDFEQ